jgi:hypothetical protein
LFFNVKAWLLERVSPGGECGPDVQYFTFDVYSEETGRRTVVVALKIASMEYTCQTTPRSVKNGIARAQTLEPKLSNNTRG